MTESAFRPTAAEAAYDRRTHCMNCGAMLAGRYCHRCGQEHQETEPTLWTLLRDTLTDVFNFQSRTLRSLVHLVVRPGELTAAYFDGRRVRYTQPVQLYLIAAAVFFLANSVRPFLRITEDNRVTGSLSAANMGTEIDARRLEELEARGVPPELFRERFRFTVAQSLPPFMAGSIVLFALALAASSPRRPALLHAVFALHWTAFFLFIMALERLAGLRPWDRDVIGVALTLGALVHLAIALRRGYGHRWPRAGISGFLLWFAFNAIVVLWAVAVTAYAARQAG